MNRFLIVLLLLTINACGEKSSNKCEIKSISSHHHLFQSIKAECTYIESKGHKNQVHIMTRNQNGTILEHIQMEIDE